MSSLSLEISASAPREDAGPKKYNNEKEESSIKLIGSTIFLSLLVIKAYASHRLYFIMDDSQPQTQFLGDNRRVSDLFYSFRPPDILVPFLQLLHADN